MTFKEKVERDGVGMRWLRTAATTVTAVAAASGVAWGVLVWAVGPRVNSWAIGLIENVTADLQAEANRTNDHLDRLDAVVERLEENIAAIGKAFEGSLAPSWRFSLPDTSISDGAIGGEVTITSSGYKMRECGVPRVDLYFVNGRGIYHRFKNASLLSPDNRGVAFPVDPDRLQKLSYRATIPADEGVMPGRAQGFISLTYPDGCPQIEEAIAGPLQFRITQ